MSQVSQDKIDLVNETEELIKKYDILAAADLYKVGSSMLQNMRKQLRGDMDIKCLKNTLMRISLNNAGEEEGMGFMDVVPGQNLFLFTNGNPFKLAMNLDRNKVKVFAKPGDKAIDDIIIPSGNTGLAPGPIISKFGALGIRTRIESGNIWVNQDTLVAEAGEEINRDLAELLQRMGIKAAEMGLSIKAVYEEGVVIPGEELLLDIADYQEQISQAFGEAYQVALKASYITPQTLPSLLIIVSQNAKNVAIEASYVSKDTVKDLIAKAGSQARSLATMVGKTQAKNQ